MLRLASSEPHIRVSNTRFFFSGPFLVSPSISENCPDEEARGGLRRGVVRAVADQRHAAAARLQVGKLGRGISLSRIRSKLRAVNGSPWKTT